MTFPWPRIWSIACPTFPASATKAMPHTRSASSSGTRPAIPAKSNEAPVACPSWTYNNRTRVERLWARLKEWRAPLRENRQILHGRPLPCRHLRLDQERLQAITGPSITVAGSLLTEKYSSFCTCSVRALCELGSRKGTNRRSKEDRAAITTSKMGGATVMLIPKPLNYDL